MRYCTLVKRILVLVVDISHLGVLSCAVLYLGSMDTGCRYQLAGCTLQFQECMDPKKIFE